MLILTRRIGETIVVGDGDTKITVTVLSVKGTQVRIGITAPRTVVIDREEIYERKQKEREALTGSERGSTTELSTVPQVFK